MISFDDIKIYLPKYLSTKSEQNLFNELKNFPENIDQRFYSDYLDEKETLFQGDGLTALLVVDFQKQKIDKAPSIILSNTCDINPDNIRYFPANVCYAPIIRLSKYERLLREVLRIEDSKVIQHLATIKKQHFTQIFYLPKGKSLEEDSIVFLDRINSCSNQNIPRENIQEKRLFTLSNYGFYVFLIKLSIHFTRMREGVDRSVLLFSS